VWLIVAGGATFAAFPLWYASMFSPFYLALFIVLVALIVRGVSFEFRGKRATRAWRVGWDWALGLGSLIPAFGWGWRSPTWYTACPLSRTGLYFGGRPAAGRGGGRAWPAWPCSWSTGPRSWSYNVRTAGRPGRWAGAGLAAGCAGLPVSGVLAALWRPGAAFALSALGIVMASAVVFTAPFPRVVASTGPGLARHLPDACRSSWTDDANAAV
jgi:cytochrome d ubiquinol oxidase subunit II